MLTGRRSSSVGCGDYGGVTASNAVRCAPILMHEPLAGGATLLELMSDEALDDARVSSAFDEIARRANALPSSAGQRLAAKGFVRRPTSLPSDD